MPELVTFAVDCAHCRRPIRLYVSERPESATHPVVWTCPHCYESNNGKFPGQIEFIDIADDER